MLLLMRSLVLLAALASCARGGVEIIVTPQDPAVTRVTLFVGVGDVMTKPIAPMSSSPLDPILAWARDKGGEADERVVVDRAPVTFQFVGGDAFGVVIAVGWNKEGAAISAAVLTDVKFMPDAIARYEMELHPTLRPERPDAFIKLTHWKSMAGPAAGKDCVVYEDKPTLKRFAVVTGGDPDCDGWPTDDANECQPQLFMSFGRPTLDQVACIAPETATGTNEQFCTLAGPPCTDGTGQETTCRAPSVYCIPATVCEQCNAGVPGSFDCARDLTRLPNSTIKPTHLHCNVYMDQQGNPCPLVKALGPLAEPTLAGRTCLADALHTVRITQVGQPWDSKVSYSAPETGTMLDVEVANLQPNCNFDLRPTGKVTAEHSFGAMVAGELDNGRGIAISIVFTVSPSLVGCFNQAPCDVRWPLANELIDRCVNQAAFPPETTN